MARSEEYYMQRLEGFRTGLRSLGRALPECRDVRDFDGKSGWVFWASEDPKLIYFFYHGENGARYTATSGGRHHKFEGDVYEVALKDREDLGVYVNASPFAVCQTRMFLEDVFRDNTEAWEADNV